MGSRTESDPARSGRQPSKKEQILSLYSAGIQDVEDLAMITQARPSYVASVLQGAEKLPAYFDLYTSSSRAMNVYSKYFAGKLGFRDQEAAQHSIDLIDHFYRQFEMVGDRAGQHHAFVMALIMFDRARWTGKAREADTFRRWLATQLEDAVVEEGRQTADKMPAAKG